MNTEATDWGRIAEGSKGVFDAFAPLTAAVDNAEFYTTWRAALLDAGVPDIDIRQIGAQLLAHVLTTTVDGAQKAERLQMICTHLIEAPTIVLDGGRSMRH